MINKKVAEDESLKSVKVPPKSPTSFITKVQRVYVPTHEDDDDDDLGDEIDFTKVPPRSPVPKPRTPPPGKYTSESDTDGGRFTPDITSGHRKSVSFDFSGDERSRSDFSDNESNKRPIKSILRTPSPSSSTNSTLERPKPDRLPIVPTIAKITEVDSPVQSLESQDSQDRMNYYPQSTDESESDKVDIDDLEYPPSRLEKFGELNERGEIQRENPFREAFLFKKPPDAYEEMAKMYSKNPPKLKREGSRSNEDLLSEETSHISSRLFFKSTENLAVIRKPKIPPPPPPKPEKTIKHADVVRNLALESFQNIDVGVGDFTVFEHNAVTNVIHQVSDMPLPPLPKSPKSPKSPKRPTESPPPPPINYATMPSLYDLPLPPPPIEILTPSPTLSLSATPIKHTSRQKQFVHENSPDNILVPEDVHRTILLQENEIRNAIRHHSTTSSECSSIKTIISNSEGSHSNNYSNISKQSVNPFLDTDDVFLESDTNSLLSSNDDHQQTNILSPTQIFPTPQILPVQYTNLPMPQNASQPQFIHIGGVAASATGVVSSTTSQLPASLPPIFCTPGFTFAPNSIFQQQQQLIQEQARQLHEQQEQLKGFMVSELSSTSALPTPPPLPPKPLKFLNTVDNNDNLYENSPVLTFVASRSSFYEEPIVHKNDDDCIYATIEESLTYIEDSSVDSCADMPPVPPPTSSLKRLSFIRESSNSLNQVEIVGKETCV